MCINDYCPDNSNDPRITKFGKFIRKYSLDELPQLFNVLKGNMSLVGPRPCLPYEWDAYDRWHKRRLDVRPGCTGLWQVSSRSEVGFDDSVILDLYYIQNMSPWFDLQLILKTIPTMITGYGGK
ncbi:sugar transferase [candidate division KSB1 bacterium]|nr:sugar transferase [candidate division KSB1 bacterium]